MHFPPSLLAHVIELRLRLVIGTCLHLISVLEYGGEYLMPRFETGFKRLKKKKKNGFSLSSVWNLEITVVFFLRKSEGKFCEGAMHFIFNFLYH